MSKAKPNVVILGHVCIDKNSIEGVEYVSWGSPAMYIANYYAQSLSVRSKIISYYGSDFNQYLSDFIDMAVPVRGTETLIYRNVVCDTIRTQYCPNPEVSPPVSLRGSVVSVLQTADILIIAPDISNYSTDYIREALSLAPKNCKKILLPQGLLRGIQDSLITKTDTESTEAVVGYFDVVIVSEEDMSNAADIALSWSSKNINLEVIVTQADKGATLYRAGESFHVPTRPLKKDEIVNPVGAGDVFSARLAIGLYEGEGTVHAIEQAHLSTSKMLTKRTISYDI